VFLHFSVSFTRNLRAPLHVCAIHPRQALIAPTANAARQRGGSSSAGIAEEVYVSVTAYSMEVRAATSFFFCPCVSSRVCFVGRERRKRDTEVFVFHRPVRPPLANNTRKISLLFRPRYFVWSISCFTTERREQTRPLFVVGIEAPTPVSSLRNSMPTFAIPTYQHACSAHTRKHQKPSSVKG